MSDQPLDIPAQSIPASGSVAPTATGGETQGSAPAPVDTTATPAKPEGQEPDRQTRRESRAFATIRRENRDLHRAIGRLEERISTLGAPPAGEGEPQRPTRTPQQIAADDADAEVSGSLIERLEDAGDEIEGFDKVMATITKPDFPINRVIRDFLSETDKPAELAQWMADNPAEVRRISRLSESVAVKALERREASLSAKPAPRTTKAPPPVPTVGGRSTASFDPQTADMDEYKAYWDKRQTKN